MTMISSVSLQQYMILNRAKGCLSQVACCVVYCVCVCVCVLCVVCCVLCCVLCVVFAVLARPLARRASRVGINDHELLSETTKIKVASRMKWV
jgi:hypothetical protein